MSDTTAPAQADEKALESWIAEQAPAILAMYRFDSEDDLRRAREAFDILKVRVPKFAAIRPEGEAVAWLDDGSTRNGSHGTGYRVVTAATKAGMPKAAAEAYTTPLFASPPAPAQVEAASLPAPGGVRVKALEWGEPYGYAARAETTVGVYAVESFPGQTQAYRLSIGMDRLSSHANLDAAKAAAQADYESRIRAALATDASPSGEIRS